MQTEKFEYCPTPSQIRESCLEIQKKWTEKDEEKHRVGGKATPFQIKVLDTYALLDEISQNP
jgi:hypothetical protein